MFGEAKGYFDGLAAVFDTADNTVATSVWNVIFEKKKKFCKVSNEIDLTFDQQKRVWDTGHWWPRNIIWQTISLGKYNTKKCQIICSCLLFCFRNCAFCRF